MKALRYCVLVIVILALIVFIAVPYSMGWWVKGQYQTWIDQANQQNPAMALSVDKYQRGWFSTSAVMHADVKDPELKQQLSSAKQALTLPFDIDMTVHHGLITYTRSPQGKKQWHIARAVITGQIKRPQVEVVSSSVVGINNHISTQALVKKLSVPLQSGTFTMSNTVIDSVSSADGDTGKAKIFIPSVVYQLGQGKAGLTVTLQGVEIGNDYTKSGELVFGKRSLSAEKMSVVYGKQHIHSSGWRLTSDVVPQDKTTDIVVHVSMQSYKDNDQTSGPLSFDLSIKQLNTDALGKFVKNVTADPSQPIQPNQLVLPLLGVLRHGIDGHLKLAYQSPYGPISVQGQISMPSNKDNSLFAIIGLLKGKIDVSLPDEWLQQALAMSVNRANIAEHQPVVGRTPAETQAKQAIALLIDKKMLIKKSNQLSLTATLEAGKVLVNGLKPNFAALTKVNEPQASTSGSSAKSQVSQPASSAKKEKQATE